MLTTSAPPPEFDLRLLESLRAEDEPWLNEVFIEPKGIESFVSPRSMIFSAPSGGGRTALRLQITQNLQQNLRDKILIVNWLPEAPQEDLAGNQLARFAMRQLIQVYTQALLNTLGENPEMINRAPEWALQGAAFFFNNYLTIEPHFYVLSIAESLPVDGSAGILRLLDIPYPQLLKPEATTQDIHRVMVLILNGLGFSGMWVFVDELEKWVAAEKEQAFQMLGAMLDTLNYFESKKTVYKIFVPSEFAAVYFTLGGSDRFRLFPQVIEYSQTDLKRIVERRLAVITKDESLSLRRLCPDPDFLTWLENAGGHNPRRWLYLIKPFLIGYMATNQGRRKPVELTPLQWQAIRDRFPQSLRFDRNLKKVYRGETELDISPSEFKILLYLYESTGQVCRREELYYKVHRGLNTIPLDSQEAGYETTWRTNLDNIILRLRKAIEPDPNQPVYLVTERGVGIRLENAW